MSKQNKLRNKRKHATSSTGNEGPKGASKIPGRQPAPPWVKNGKRKPEAVRKREAEAKALREAAEREARKAKREAEHAN